MKFICPISGKALSFLAFESNAITYRLHPIVEALSTNNHILRISHLSKQSGINKATNDELIFATAALLNINPLIQVHCPIKPDIELLRENFSRFFFATAFCATTRTAHRIPGFSITIATANLSSLLSGWVEEVEAEKASIRKRYREEVMSRMEERHNRKLRKRIFAGKTIFHHLIDYRTLEWLFSCMDIPSDDWDCYRRILYNDVWDNIKTPNCSTRILELEAYLENWFSLNVHKSLLQKHIHKQLSEFLDMGGSLPKDYYTKDEDGNMESLLYGQLDSFRKVVKPKLVFKPVTEQVVKPTSSPRPKKDDYPNLVAYAKAVLEWNRKNVLH